MAKTVTEIVKAWLTDNKYDGLCNADIICGCSITDIAPCGEMGSDCTAARREYIGDLVVFVEAD